MGWTGNFKTRMEDLSGTLAVSDDAALQQFLLNGCYDILRRITVKEGDAIRIEFASNLTVSTSEINVGGYQDIVLVDRQNGSSAFVRALNAPTEFEDKLGDATSIYFATGTTPKYIQKAQIVKIFPSPTATDTARIYYIPEYAITNWDTGVSSIDNFPQKHYQNVALYGAIQLLHRKMNDIDLSSDITPMAAFTEAFSTSTAFSATQASAPSITTVSYSAASTITPDVPAPISIETTVSSAAPSNQTIPSYTPPKVGGVTEELTAAMDAIAGEETPLGTDANFDDFSRWFQIAAEFIEDEEDTELASSQLQKISTYITAYQAALSNQQAVLQANTTHYQALVQQENQAKQDANRATLQTITNDLQKAQANLGALQQTAQIKASNAQAKALQDAQQTVQAIIQDNGQKISKYQAELSSYTNEVQAFSQNIGTEVNIYGQKIQKYQQELQKFAQDVTEKKLELERKTKDYEWLSTNYSRLRAEYEQIFAVAPQDQTQQQQ